MPYLPFTLPILFLYPLVSGTENELYRVSAVIVLGFIALFAATRSNLRQVVTRQPWILLVFGLVIVMIFSSLLSENKAQAIIGIPGDFQGLLLQLSSIIIGYYAASKMTIKNFWRVAAYASGLVCMLSTLFDIPTVLHGYRLSGLLFHATGIALYAAVALSLNVTVGAERKRNRFTVWSDLFRWASIIAAVSTLVLSASRIGLIAAVASLLLIAVFKPARRQLSLTVAVLCVGLVLVGGNLIKSVNRVSDAGRVETGVSYRLQLYQWSISLSSPSLLGVGASQVDTVLQPRDEVATPVPIQKTLNEGFAFWYSHCQFIDMYIQYGVAGLLLFGGLIGWALVNTSKLYGQALRKRQEIGDGTLCASVCLIVVLLHLLVNTPSVELYPLVFFAIFAGFTIKRPVQGLS